MNILTTTSNSTTPQVLIFLQTSYIVGENISGDENTL